MSNGKAAVKIYQPAQRKGFPNQKPKRIRKENNIIQNESTIIFNFNIASLLFIAIVYLAAPLSLFWRLGICGMILFSACTCKIHNN